MLKRWRVFGSVAVAAVALTACFGPGSYPTKGPGSVPPGRYHLFDAPDHCRWAMRHNGQLVAWSNGGGEVGFPSYAELEATSPADTIDIDGCLFRLADSTWDKKFRPDANGEIGDGMYRVGAELPPGTYEQVSPTASICFWQRVSSFVRDGGQLRDVIDQAILDENAVGTVTIEPTDAGFISWWGCGKWKKIA